MKGYRRSYRDIVLQFHCNFIAVCSCGFIAGSLQFYCSFASRNASVISWKTGLKFPLRCPPQMYFCCTRSSWQLEITARILTRQLSPPRIQCLPWYQQESVKHDSWPMQPDILSPPLLRLTSRKPLWLDLQLQLTSKVDGGITGSRLRWSILT